MTSIWKHGLLFALGTTVLSTTILNAKGLDKLQASDPEVTSPTTPVDSQETVPGKAEPATNKPEGKEGEKTAPNTPTPQAQAPDSAQQSATNTEKVAGDPRFYFSQSLGLINISNSKAGWYGSFAPEFELGLKTPFKFRQYQFFGTYRYRTADVIARKPGREFRGNIESHFFGIRGDLFLNPKLLAYAQSDLGIVSPHLNPSDSRVGVPKDLESTAVELDIAGGIAYFVLDRLSLGSRLTLGAGGFKTVLLAGSLQFYL